tara:strand:- start:32 stop:1093 length:1062 start_codon:yes stop_codon:yes gene_type:complete
MKKIAVIGANGQVGTEVCIHLKEIDDFEVIPICRSNSSTAFLRKIGLDCKVVDMEDSEQVREILTDIDIVIDFSYPKGTAKKVREMTRRIISNVLRYAPTDSLFIYMSSIVAFGVHSSSPWVRRHVFSHTPYGALKRYGERVTRFLGLFNRKKIYILRLGQVHGEMQSVGRKMEKEIENRHLSIPFSGNVHSPTVFCSTISEAICSIVKGKEKPGRYTLVSNPEPTWRELYEFYARKEKKDLEITSSGYLGYRSNLFDMKSIISSFMKRNREFIAAQILKLFPNLELRLSGKYWIKKAEDEISKNPILKITKPRVFLGSPPGKRLKHISKTDLSKESESEIIQKRLKNIFSED